MHTKVKRRSNMETSNTTAAGALARIDCGAQPFTLSLSCGTARPNMQQQGLDEAALFELFGKFIRSQPLGFGAGPADQGPSSSRSTADTCSHPESQKHATRTDEAGDDYTKMFVVCFSFEIQLIC